VSTPSIPITTSDEAATDGVVLVPGRAAWVPAASTVLVADLHLGKAAAFRRAGIPVPEGSAAADLDRLASLVRRWRPSRVVVLGDLFHARAGMTAAVEEQFRAGRAALGDVEVVLVEGNHDTRIRDRLARLGLDGHVNRLVLPPLVLVHDPLAEPVTAGRLVVGGHHHPRVTVGAPSGDRITERCFLAAGGRLVLPAFGSFTGGGPLAPPADARVWMARDDVVVEVTRLLRLAAGGRKA